MAALPKNSSPVVKSPGYWRETWRRFRRRKLAMLSLAFVVGLFVIAILAPLIVGTKPILCRYKGSIYFPALGYYHRSWENPIFYRDNFHDIYARNLQEKDPESWAIWPLVYQDPARPISKIKKLAKSADSSKDPDADLDSPDDSAQMIEIDEWEGQPANPKGVTGLPNRYNLMGTTSAGNDVFAALVHGTRISLLIGFVSTGIAALIGIPLGAMAGFFRGGVDIVISRLIEVVLCVPSLILILALVALVDHATIFHIMAIIGLTSWTSIARLTRAEFMKLNESEFVTAARALGVGRFRIMFRHILPNALAPVLVPITFGISSAILIESALSVLGITTSSEVPSWGTLLYDGGSSNVQQMWWITLFAGSAIFLSVLAYNIIGEGLQEATDPRLREAGK